MPDSLLPTITAIRYVAPLREGGSVPAIVEADDDGTYVLKFRGAGQGRKALIAELVAGEIGRALGLPVPDLAVIELDGVLGRAEPDPEIKTIIDASVGLNLAVDYLPGSLGFGPLDERKVDGDLASAIVWFDAYVSNVDRTPRNPNMLWWHRRLYLIDHGAALYFHHNWGGDDRSRSPFAVIKDHVLLRRANALEAADEEMAVRLPEETIRQIVASIPDDWLGDEASFPDVAAHRQAYVDYLLRRLQAPRPFVEEALRARAKLL
ncbi:MAG: HipA family kinase [Anaerolineae bacterium]